MDVSCGSKLNFRFRSVSSSRGGKKDKGNWLFQLAKSLFCSNKIDALVVAFRRWLNKYAGGQVDWGAKFTGVLPPTPPREQLMDRLLPHKTESSSKEQLAPRCNKLSLLASVKEDTEGKPRKISSYWFLMNGII
ncbi:protochlorophyllide-dependent translocon component 52, chloroplastic-like [Diospyros lotus]|uniref:protochlorophyllide-dependent translocon component 52, chloroplastic-like n=1 Tax=Diospyros lotus TaxID=55363 RepID=UPI00224EE214|nr:protochlorophyllide-dependent translocon component 52, chloroplastic-like [Diospyros lotus]